MVMKLRSLFRLCISKEHKCFHKFTTFPDGSDLYLSVFFIVHCGLKALERNAIPLTNQCWFELGHLKYFLAPYSQYV